MVDCVIAKTASPWLNRHMHSYERELIEQRSLFDLPMSPS